MSVHLYCQMKRKRALLESNPDRDTFDERRKRQIQRVFLFVREFPFDIFRVPHALKTHSTTLCFLLWSPDFGAADRQKGLIICMPFRRECFHVPG